MHLASRLRHTTLGDLLASLHRAGASGVLELIEPHARHAIHLRRGFVQAVESDSTATRLGDLAVRARRVPRPQLERARFLAQTRGMRLGQAMVAARLLSPGELDELLAAQQRERLERLFQLPDAEVRFRVARPLPAGATDVRPLYPREVFHGRPRLRRRDGGSGAGAGTHHARSSARGASGASSPATQGASSPHAVLGVVEGASAAEIRGAYRRLVLDLHPDRAEPEASEAERSRRARRLLAVIDAYRALSA